MKNYVYSFGGGTADGDGKMKDVLGGKGAGLAEMSPRGSARASRLHHFHRSLQHLFREQATASRHEINEQVLTALAQARRADRQEAGRSRESAAGQRSLRRELLHAGHDEHHSQPGPERRHHGEGLAALTGNPRFAYDSYRRFIQMFGEVALDIDMEKFDHIFDARKTQGQSQARHRPDRRRSAGHHRRLQEAGPEGNQEAVPAGRARAARHVARRRVPVLVESQGRLLPQDGKDSG